MPETMEAGAAPAVTETVEAKTPTSLVNEAGSQSEGDNQDESNDDKSLLGDAKEDGVDGSEKKEVEASDKKDAKAEGVPEKYEVKLPEGMELDTKMMEGLSPVFKKLGLTGEEVQEIVDAYAPLVKAQVDNMKEEAIKSWEKQLTDWRGDTEKTLGSEKKQQLALAARAIEKSGVKGLRELMDETGIGNALPLVQFFAWAGKLVSSDNFVEGNAAVGKTKSFLDIYDHPTSKATLKY